MPRSGSHLLSAILNQNPQIHSEGMSALCRILWDLNQSMNNPITQHELNFFNRNTINFKTSVNHSVVNSYYEGIENKIILDKNRSWTIQDNIDLVNNYLETSPKFIVMTRDTEEIVKSFVKLHLSNGYKQAEAEDIILNFDSGGTNPFMRPLAATVWAKAIANHGNFLFIDYKDLMNDIDYVINSIYDFIEIEYFYHNFNNIEMKYKERSHLVGLADVRKNISAQENNVVLSKRANEKIEYINNILDLTKDPQKNIMEIKKFYSENCF